MADRHESIVREVMLQWSREKRGRIFKNDNGKAWRGRITDERVVGGKKTIELFCAVMIKYGLFPGSSDLIGWEFAEYIDASGEPVTVPIFCAIEVKTTGYKRINEEQQNWLNAIARMGGRAYVARESADGYELKLCQ